MFMSRIQEHSCYKQMRAKRAEKNWNWTVASEHVCERRSEYLFPKSATPPQNQMVVPLTWYHIGKEKKIKMQFLNCNSVLFVHLFKPKNYLYRKRWGNKSLFYLKFPRTRWHFRGIYTYVYIKHAGIWSAECYTACILTCWWAIYKS